MTITTPSWSEVTPHKLGSAVEFDGGCALRQPEVTSLPAVGIFAPAQEVALALDDDEIEVLPLDEAQPKAADGTSTGLVIAAHQVEVIQAPTPAEQAVIDAAVAKINSMQAEAGVKLARQIGTYILDVFYGGNLEDYGRKTSKGHTSLRRLAEHPNLNVGGGLAFISRCVNVTVMLDGWARKLPKEPQLQQLGWSECVELLPVRKADLRVALARQIIKRPRPIKVVREVIKQARIKEGDLSVKPPRDPRPTARGITTAAKDLHSRLSLHAVGTPGADRDEMVTALTALDDKIRHRLAEVEAHNWVRVSTSKHAEAGEPGADVAVLRVLVESIIQSAQGLDPIGRWRFLRDARKVFQHHYEACPRPDTSDLIRDFVPAPMLAGYAGSKQPVVGKVLEELAKIVPPDGPYSRVLVEPFTGLAAVSRYALQTGIVDQVRLNDADPAIAALLNSVINNPAGLHAAVKRLGGEVPSQKILDRLWRSVRSARNEWKRSKLMPQHRDERLGAAALVLLGCARGKGLIDPPSEEMAASQWSAQRTLDHVDEWHDIFLGRVAGNECTCSSAFDVLKEPAWGLAFVDPPYEGKEDFYSEDFGPEDHNRLSLDLVQCRRPWLLTYGDTQYIRTLYEADGDHRYSVQRVDVPRASNNTVEAEVWITPGKIYPWPTETIPMAPPR